MPKILDIVFKRRRPERFLVLWDNGEEQLFSPEIAAIYQFKINKIFDEETYLQILLEDGIRRAKDQMMKYLGIRSHSEQELRLKTLKKGYTEAQIEQALVDMKKLNLIDDAKFTRQFIQNEMMLRPVGRKMLQNKLFQKGVAPEVFDPILDELCPPPSQEAAIRILAEKFLRRNERHPKEKRIEKLIRHLQSKGFGWDLISWVLYHSGLVDSTAE